MCLIFVIETMPNSKTLDLEVGFARGTTRQQLANGGHPLALSKIWLPKGLVVSPISGLFTL